MNDLVKYDAELKEVSEMVDSAYFQLEEAAQSLDRYRDTISTMRNVINIAKTEILPSMGLKKNMVIP